MTATQHMEPTPAAPAQPLRVLIVDDEESMRHFLLRGLKRRGMQPTAVADGSAAIAAWSEQCFDAMVLDLRMPGIDGLHVLGRVRAFDPDAVVLLMTAHGSISSAVEAMKIGAADFLTKPFEADELSQRLARAVANRRQSGATTAPVPAASTRMVGSSATMRDLSRRIELVADSAATVLVSGESGTGKGVVARAVHDASPRRDRPFVVLHCPAVPETLFEAALFGHEAGAFTGATHSRVGLIAKADGGTLFLDEVGAMSLAAQAKLERFLQEREFTPLGAGKAERVDVRIVAASNRDLAADAQQGRFRSELLWRLDVVRLHVPPLRQRRDDVPALIEHCLARLAAIEKSPPRHLTADAVLALQLYDWPGNVRELENVVERMVVLGGARDTLGVADLPPEIQGLAIGEMAGSDYEAARRRFDLAYFEALLQRCDGNVTEAARQAGLSRGHLHRRLRELRAPLPPGTPPVDPATPGDPS